MFEDNAMYRKCTIILLAFLFFVWTGPLYAMEEASEYSEPGIEALDMLDSEPTFGEDGPELEQREREEESSGVFSVRSNPDGAKVYVDGEDKGTTPAFLRDLSGGNHEIVIFMPGYGAFTRIVEGSSGSIMVDMEEEKSYGMGFLSVSTTPADARIDVDDKKIGLSPLEAPMEAGKHRLTISKVGYKPVEMEVEIETERTHKVELVLEGKEGSLLVVATPSGAEISVDGTVAGKAWEPFRVEDLSAGSHEVQVRKDGYRTWTKRDVRVKSGETTTVMAALLPERDYSMVRLFTDPLGARVVMDGKEIGIAGEEGLGFKAQKGAHSFLLEINPSERPGYQPLKITVSFDEDEIDYASNPFILAKVDENYTQALALVARDQREAALGFLERVSPDHQSYGAARLLVIDILSKLGRENEIPLEFETLLSIDKYKNNPVLNTAMGYWCLVASKNMSDPQSAQTLQLGAEALDRAAKLVDLFPPDQRNYLVLKSYYYSGMTNEVLFNLTGDKKHVKRGVQAWELFFARLELAPDALEGNWIEKARSHRQTLEFLAKKLGG